MTPPNDAPKLHPPRDEGRDDVRSRLDRLVFQARAAIGWERAWPFLWLPLALVLAFVATAWLGVWNDLPVLARKAGVAVAALLFLASFVPLLRLRRPSREAGLDRVDRDSGRGHRPARTLEDTLALGSNDPGAQALWRLHRRRAAESVSALTVTPPRPGMSRRDPWALRAALIAATAATAFVAGPEWRSRLVAPFDWSGPAATAPAFRVDGWIDPPRYTRLPPLMIDLASGAQTMRAPVGSIIVLRMAGKGEASVSHGSGLVPLESDAGREGLREYRYRLAGPAELELKTGLAARAGLGSATRLSLEAIPDRVPEVALNEAPEVNARGTFVLSYNAKDDYGLASAEGRVERADGASGRRSLVPPPSMPLQLPGDHRSGEDAKTTVDLTDHPWGGARVRLRLAVRDEAEQEGLSAPVDLTLPQRPFSKPLAKALVEQRRQIILDPDQRRPVQTALDSLLIAPDRFTPEWGVFLGLKAAAERYRAAKTDEDLTGVAEWLWAMALQIEEGDLSEAEKELRAAQERLREAMERGADEKEIARLTDDLQRAMDRFLREFAEQMQRDQRNGEQSPPNGQERTITQNDLNRMMQEMQEAMKRGDVAEAQRLLEQLKNILENLKTARPGNRMSDPQAREMSRQMNELDALTREQQQLRDETFQRDQGRPGAGENQQGRRPGQRGQRGQQGEGQRGERGQRGEGGEGSEGQGGLGERQRALRERLEALQRRMRGMGMQGEQGFGDAEGAMRDAEGQLGQGRDGQAVDSQGRALEGLQRGMQGMAQQMQKMMGDNIGDDQGGEPGGPGNPQGRASNDARSDDPLGRPMRSRDFSDGRVRIPGADESAVARARRILDELRRKLGDPLRPREELDYFERLLRRN